ncbi:hypothetical protein V6N13_071642 [Hibiscus sabdariffa]
MLDMVASIKKPREPHDPSIIVPHAIGSNTSVPVMVGDTFGDLHLAEAATSGVIIGSFSRLLDNSSQTHVLMWLDLSNHVLMVDALT